MKRSCAARNDELDEEEPIAIAQNRLAQRHALGVEVSLTSESQFFVGLTGNISTGGVFVATYETRAVGSRIDLEFTLPSGIVRARGIVRWLRVTRDGGTPGFGVAFEELTRDERTRIESFCKERAPLYYDVEDSP